MRSTPKTLSRIAIRYTWVGFGILFARTMQVHVMTYISTFSDPYFRSSSHNSVARSRRPCFQRNFMVPDKISIVSVSFIWGCARSAPRKIFLALLYGICYQYFPSFNIEWIIIDYWKFTHSFSGLASFRSFSLLFLLFFRLWKKVCGGKSPPCPPP